MSGTVLARGIEVVGVLFVSFGGFLLGLAPPEDADALFAVGIASFGALIVLLLVAAVTGQRTTRRRKNAWIGGSAVLFVVCLTSAYAYKSSCDALLFEYPPDSARAEYVGGTKLTPAARDVMKQHPGLSKPELLAGFGGLAHRNLVWGDSVRTARMRLIALYVLCVLSLCGSIFALTEGAMVRPDHGGGAAKRP